MAKKKQDKITHEPADVLACIEKARQLTFDWAIASGINLISIDLVTPSIDVYKKFSVWLFFDTDSQLQEYEANGTTQKIKDKYLSTLKELNCPAEYLKGVIFFTDSVENVKRFSSIEPLKIG